MWERHVRLRRMSPPEVGRRRVALRRTCPCGLEARAETSTAAVHGLRRSTMMHVAERTLVRAEADMQNATSHFNHLDRFDIGVRT